MMIDYTSNALITDNDLINCLIEIEGAIKDFDENDDDFNTIGKIRAYYVDAIAADRLGISLFDVIDTNGNVSYICEKIINDFEKQTFYSKLWKPFGWDKIYAPSNFMIIDAVAIHAPHRGQMIGLASIYRTIQQFSHGCDFVILSVRPLQFHKEFDFLPENIDLDQFERNKKLAREKLKAHYGKLGFKPIPKSDLMIMNLSYDRPTLEEISYSRR